MNFFQCVYEVEDKHRHVFICSEFRHRNVRGIDSNPTVSGPKRLMCLPKICHFEDDKYVEKIYG